MKNQMYIPVQNDLKKAIAFAPSLERDYFRKTRMIEPKNFIEPISTLEKLQKEGWYIEGVAELKNGDFKSENVNVRLYHPDIAMVKSNGTIEGTSNLYISNSLIKNNMEMFLGFYRLVCSNGLVREEGERWNIKNEDQLQHELKYVEAKADEMIQQFQRLKEHELSPQIQRELAKKALECRFTGGVASNIDSLQLLNCHRDEDKGNDVWSIFNRMQENLIKPAMLKNKQGQNINGVFDPQYNISVNTRLYGKVVEPFIKK